MTARRILSTRVFGVLASALCCNAAFAQDASSRSCLDSIPASAFHTTTAFIEAAAADLSAPERGLADTVVHRMAERARVVMGGTIDSIPDAEPAVTWRAFERGVRVTLRRSGPPSAVPTGESGDTSLTAVFGRTLREIPATNLPAWPTSIERDSVAFTIDFVAPAFSRDGTPPQPSARLAFPVFYVRQPWEQFAALKTIRRTSYPEINRQEQVTGTVILRFSVDTAGSADPATLTELWPAHLPRLQGTLGQAYARFLDASKTAVLASAFTPAMIGGCKVRQVVEQPFTFSLTR